MANFNKQVNTEMSEWEQLKHLQRVQKRDERLEKESANNHRKFISGKLVGECLLRVNEIPVYKGKDAKEKNVKASEPLRRLLVAVAANEELMAQFNADMDRLLSQAEEF
jgi:hypothetical protein